MPEEPSINRDETLANRAEREIDDWGEKVRKRPFIAFVVICLVLIPPGWSFFYWLRASTKIESLEESVSSLTKERDEATRAKDAAESKLAPFWAQAAKVFGGQPETNRLALLIDRMQALENISINVGRDNSGTIIGKQTTITDPPRRIDGEQKAQLVWLLKNASKGNVRISFQAGDGEAQHYAFQLESIFKEAGFANAHASGGHTIFNGAQPDLIFGWKGGLGPTNWGAQVIGAFYSVGVRPLVDTNTYILGDTLLVEVGPKPFTGSQ